MAGSASDAGARRGVRPPMEVVLPLPYYLVLVAEVVALTTLTVMRPAESGGDRYALWLGWGGTLSMCIMHVYSLRRRVRAFRGLGPIRSWLHFHIFMGLQGALLVSFHASHLRTLGNIAAANIIVTLTVVASGIFGRYLYAMIPKGVTGERLTAREVEGELEGLTVALAGAAPTPELALAVGRYAEGPKLHGRVPLRTLVAEDARSRRALADLERSVRAALHDQVALRSVDEAMRVDRFLALARRRVLLARRLLTLGTADAFFRNWTLFHKPLTFVLLGLTLLHILTHYLYGV